MADAYAIAARGVGPALDAGVMNLAESVGGWSPASFAEFEGDLLRLRIGETMAIGRSRGRLRKP